MNKGFSTVIEASTLTTPGRHRDLKTPGLYINVSNGKAGLTRSYVYRFKMGGKAFEMGLGAVASVALADARKAVREAAALRDKGINPIARRAAARAALKPAAKPTAAKANSFRDFAESYIRERSRIWRHPTTASMWRNTFKKWIYPAIGNIDVGDLTTQ